MRNHRFHVIALVLLIGATACQKPASESSEKAGSNAAGSAKPAATKPDSEAAKTADTGSGSGSGSAAAEPPVVPKDIDSKDILSRTETSESVYVMHVLLAWKDLAPTYRGQMDPRAANRTNEEAAKLAQEMAAKLKDKPELIDSLVKESSEDPGAKGGDPYHIKADTPFVPEFKNLAMRLKEKEVGIVRTSYGYHVMERIAKPAPDPLESADIMGRKPETGLVYVQHVLIGWKDTPAGRSGRGDKRAMERSKADADKLAKEVLGKAKTGDMAKLMKEFSEDPGSKDTGKPYDVTPTAGFVEPFKDMALRLKVNEVGIVKTQFGWHVMKRVPPPPPDALESADILKREPPAAKSVVRHILLGWKDVNSGDERAKNRDRAALEKLVKDTVAKLKKGEKIEPLMAELSEDPGSAKTGKTYDATPEAGLVEPFKNLALRLKVNEVGVVKTDFGIHIIQRVE